jgi:uncharacterized protein with HEPN domain
VIRDPRLYLDDILESIDAIAEYTANLDEDAFRDARLVQDAVLRRLQIIGEAVKRLPANLREKYPNVPWRQMAGTRDVVVHDYSGLDLGLTWSVATRELPPVKQQIQQMLGDLSREME